MAGKTRTIIFELDQEIKLDILAKNLMVTPNVIIREALRLHLERYFPQDAEVPDKPVSDDRGTEYISRTGQRDHTPIFKF